MAKGGKKGGGRGYVWVLMPRAADVEYLRERIGKKGPLWSEWEYKLIGDRILILDPVTPMNWDTKEPDPARRYMAKHLRIVSTAPGGPFQLQYMRHTGQWWPLPCGGTIQQIADFIEGEGAGWCQPMQQTEWERGRRQR